MFGLGFGEIILVLVVALLVLGPEKLPALAKTLGKGMREFRRAASEFQRGFNDIEEEANRAMSENPKLDSVNSEGTVTPTASPADTVAKNELPKPESPQNSETAE